MTVASVTNSTTSAAAATSASLSSSTSGAKASSAMGKDDFLKLLVAQLSHQDPTQPTEGTEFVTQLAQFSLVEQSMNQSTALGNLSTQLTGIQSNDATSLIGKSVTVHGNGMSWDGLSATNTSVNLGANAANVTVQVQDSTGKTVRTLQMGAQPGGAMGISWDGKDDSGQPAAKGTYKVAVTATSAAGNNIVASSDVSGTVTKVTYDQGYPEVTLDSGVSAAISDLVSVGGTAGGTVK